MNDLTVKQRKFINAYLISGNASRAAIEAGYSPKCARAIGQENLTKPNISQEINRRLKQIEEQFSINRDKVIRGLLKEAQNEDEGSTHSARVRAWECLGKTLGLFMDKKEISIKAQVKIIYGILARVVPEKLLEIKEEIEREIAKYKKRDRHLLISVIPYLDIESP